MFIENRNEARDYFFHVWDKLNKKIPLEPLEGIISDVIMQHPEYHTCLDSRNESIDNDFKPEQNKTNPFLHMGMHIALKEQISSDRPEGINSLFNRLLSKFASEHDVEHKMMECLGQSLWEAQRNNSFPDENKYMECLKRIT